jgi:hypothetical protein
MRRFNEGSSRPSRAPQLGPGDRPIRRLVHGIRGSVPARLAPNSTRSRATDPRATGPLASRERRTLEDSDAIPDETGDSAQGDFILGSRWVESTSSRSPWEPTVPEIAPLGRCLRVDHRFRAGAWRALAFAIHPRE